jgi:hypothetical protein
MLKAHFLLAIALAAILTAALAAAAQEETAAEALDDMIEGELEIGRLLALAPTEARRSDKHWQRYRKDRVAELSIMRALRREGADGWPADDMWSEFNRRRIEAGVSSIWVPKPRDPDE